MDIKYGFGKNPPYSLYQNEDGRWGLVDGSGNRFFRDNYQRLINRWNEIRNDANIEIERIQTTGLSIELCNLGNKKSSTFGRLIGIFQ